MPNTWPAQLPQQWPLGTEEQSIDGRIRFPEDSGPARIYREFTATPRIYRITNWVISAAQRDALETFWTTLGGGVATFEWEDPFEGAGIKTMRFQTRPIYRRTTPSIWIPLEMRAGGASEQELLTVDFELEELSWYPA